MNRTSLSPLYCKNLNHTSKKDFIIRFIEESRIDTYRDKELNDWQCAAGGRTFEDLYRLLKGLYPDITEAEAAYVIMDVFTEYSQVVYVKNNKDFYIGCLACGQAGGITFHKNRYSEYLPFSIQIYNDSSDYIDDDYFIRDNEWYSYFTCERNGKLSYGQICDLANDFRINNIEKR